MSLFKKIKSLILKINNFGKVEYKKSYSQSGEDLIINFLFGMFDIKKPFYIDIGAHAPKYLSNTYFFYKKGATGICIEPDPFLIKQIQKKRKKDLCLNVGMGPKTDKRVKFYIMSARTISTFSKTEAEFYERSSSYGEQKIEEIITVPIYTFSDLVEKHNIKNIDLISLDVEGYELDILKTIDFSTTRPVCICVEVNRYEAKNEIKRDHGIGRVLKENGYFLYADTMINNIFVDKEVWNKKYKDLNI